MNKVLIVRGGWENHEPEQKAEIVRGWLEEEGLEVKISGSLAAFSQENLTYYRLIIPIWSTYLTDETLTREQASKVAEAVAGGVGIAGFHNGMYSFPGISHWHFMTGAHWVAHPGNLDVTYKVNLKQALQHPITEGLDDFMVCSEQFYMHVDPAAAILATTRFPIADGPHAANGEVDIPVALVKKWGKGRIYYCSLGHIAAQIATEPTATLIKRGLLWAAGEL